MTEEVDLEEILQLFTEEERKGIGKHLLEELGKPENQVRLLTRTVDDLNKKCSELIGKYDSERQVNSQLVKRLEKLGGKLNSRCVVSTHRLHYFNSTADSWPAAAWFCCRLLQTIK